MNVSIQTMAEKIRDFEEFVIVYHIRPDGDCIGSAFALALALKSIDAKCRVAGRDEIPPVHRFMTDRVVQDELSNPVYFAVDSVSPARTGNFQDCHYTFCVDHHNDNSIDADYKYVEEDCGACSEIVFKLIKAMGVDITKEIADFLYTALVTDTMCFRTSDTDIQTFEIAAELAKAGADIFAIARRNMFVKSKQRLRLEEILRSSFHYTCDDRILTGMITLKDLEEADILDSQLEGINSMVEQVEGVRIGATIRELPDGRIRCSLRTNGNIGANEICAVHGGGGHYHAACCELDTDMLTARGIIEETCKKFLLDEKTD